MLTKISAASRIIEENIKGFNNRGESGLRKWRLPSHLSISTKV